LPHLAPKAIVANPSLNFIIADQRVAIHGLFVGRTIHGLFVGRIKARLEVSVEMGRFAGERSSA
jgi:hypothetical protein